MFSYLFAAFIILLLLVDRVFLPRSARRAWTVMACFMGVAATLSLAPRLIGSLSDWLGVGRPVDLILYVTTVLLLREVFLARARSDRTLRALTQITRAQSLASARRIT